MTSVKELHRQKLLDLANEAEADAQWLRYSEGNGDIYMSPQQVRDLADHRHMQSRAWSIVSPLDFIAEKALALQIAFQDFERTRATVTAWYARRKQTDVIADKEAIHE